MENADWTLFNNTPKSENPVIKLLTSFNPWAALILAKKAAIIIIPVMPIKTEIFEKVAVIFIIAPFLRLKEYYIYKAAQSVLG